MDDKLFIIAIGGTGMRCLESFVHMCAAGLFDNRTIDILTLDTDQSNGNKGRVEQLIDLYNKVKTDSAQNEGGDPRSDTFFSAKLNLYRFFTEYSQADRKSFVQLAATRNLPQEKRDDNRDLSDLFFDHDSVQQFPLDHGYRAQTHLGSLLMYHGILEAAIKVKNGEDVKDHEKDLQTFLQLINQNSGNSRVFVFGSVFGGTGASSIPVIPIALRDALKVITDKKNEINLDRVKFGSTLLTDYFSFNMPTDQQRSKDKVIADSANFALNSQAAMNFYDNDLTVKNAYKMLYHIGWPANTKINYSENQDGEVVTGGQDQKNMCHVVELLSAAAAYDFFSRESFSQPQAQYVFRSVETSDNGQLRLTGASFVGEEDGPMFEQRMGAFLSLSHLILSRFGGAQEGTVGTIEFLKDLKDRNVDTFNAITDEQARQLDNYLKEFAYKFVNGKLEPGWLHQIFKSVAGGSFIFSSESLSTNPSELQKVDPGSIYNDDKYNWDYGIGLGSKADRRLSRFIDLLKSNSSAATANQASNLKEKFIGTLYNAIIGSQKNSQTNRV